VIPEQYDEVKKLLKQAKAEHNNKLAHSKAEMLPGKKHGHSIARPKILFLRNTLRFSDIRERVESSGPTTDTKGKEKYAALSP
jgi:hypothetical protein